MARKFFRNAWMWSGLGAFGLLAGTATAQDAKPMPAPGLAPAVSGATVIMGSYESGCSTTGCFNSCDIGCDCGHGHPLVDVSFLILSPYWNNDPAMFVVKAPPPVDRGPQVAVAKSSDPVVDVKDFGRPEQFVPRIYLGYVNADGWGGRIGWWGFATGKTEFVGVDDLNVENGGQARSASPLGLSVAGGEGLGHPDGGLVAQEELRMDVWDFEAIKTFESGNLSLLVSGGIRYAHVGMNYNAAELFSSATFPGAAPGTPHFFLLSGHNFNGAGLTSSVEARYGRTLYVAGTLRGSLLYGPGSQHATLAEKHLLDGIQVFDDVQSNDNELVPVIEGQLGIGIKGSESRAIVPFFEIGVNLQGWFNLGNPSQSTVAVLPGGFLPNPTPPSFTGSATGDQTLGLFGFYIRGGLTY
jgi:hypothetical protein